MKNHLVMPGETQGGPQSSVSPGFAISMHKRSDPPWFRPRGYLHFDVAISKERAIVIATDPAQVAAHAFYPLLSYAINTVKVQRNSSRRTITKVSKK